jgi:hypothetical protein
MMNTDAQAVAQNKQNGVAEYSAVSATASVWQAGWILLHCHENKNGEKVCWIISREWTSRH